MTPALARLQRGFPRMGAAVRRAPAQFNNWWHERRPETEGMRVTANETRVMLGLMRDAAASSEMTEEQRMLLARALPGMRNREAVLLQIPNRAYAEEMELQMIRRDMAEIEGRNAPPPRIRGFLGPAAVMPGLGLLASPVAWVAVAFAVPAIGATVQTMRLNHAKSDLMETREQLEQAVAEREGWRERAEQYAAAVTDAREAAQQTAEALAAERRAQARAAARERRRQREIQDVLANSPEPPAWSLRDDEPVSQ